MGDEQNLERLVLISSTENDSFAQHVSDYLGKPLAQIERRSFVDGDLLLRIGDEETVRERDVYLIMTSSPEVPLSKRLQELIVWTDALISGSAKKLTFVLPIMPGARQDRKTRRGESINVRAYMGALEGVGRTLADRIGWITVDIHSAQSQQLSMNFDNFPADPLFTTHVKSNYKLNEDVVVAAADPGGVKLADPFAKMLGINYAGSVSKIRDSRSGGVSDYGFSGKDLEGKTVIFREDMIDTAGTLETASRVVREAGAKEVIVYATHLLLNEPAPQRIRKIKAKIVGTDTVYQRPELLRKLRIQVIPISYLVAEAIKRKHQGETTRGLHSEDATEMFRDRYELAQRITNALGTIYVKR